jgi:hypothetical protein
MVMRTWSYLINTFLSVTEGSYRLCKKIGDYSVNALQAQAADPFFQGLLAQLQPQVTAFNTLYASWKQQLGAQKGKTSALNIELKTLQGEKIGKWDILIQVVYPQNSPQYMGILPNRRKPFQQGSQEDRIAAVAALSGALTGIQQLNGVKSDVDGFLATLTNAFNLQKQNLSTTDVDSTALDAARVEVCVALYGILGLLMHHFRTHPEDADNYFATESIRNHEQTTFKGTVPVGELKLALTHTFIEGEEVRLVNRGLHDLRFALCTEPNDALHQPSVTVTAGNEIIVYAEELGNLATQRYLKVQSLVPNEEGKYIIMLL